MFKDSTEDWAGDDTLFGKSHALYRMSNLFLLNKNSKLNRAVDPTLANINTLERIPVDLIIFESLL